MQLDCNWLIHKYTSIWKRLPSFGFTDERDRESADDRWSLMKMTSLQNSFGVNQLRPEWAMSINFENYKYKNHKTGLPFLAVRPRCYDGRQSNEQSIPIAKHMHEKEIEL